MSVQETSGQHMKSYGFRRHEMQRNGYDYSCCTFSPPNAHEHFKHTTHRRETHESMCTRPLRARFPHPQKKCQIVRHAWQCKSREQMRSKLLRRDVPLKIRLCMTYRNPPRNKPESAPSSINDPKMCWYTVQSSRLLLRGCSAATTVSGCRCRK